MAENSNWYNNKELFEKIQELRDMLTEEIPELKSNFKSMQTELKSTKEVIKKYNGLREDLGTVKSELKEELGVVKNDVKALGDRIETKEKIKGKTKKDWQWTLGWIVGLAGILLSFFR